MNKSTKINKYQNQQIRKQRWTNTNKRLDTSKSQHKLANSIKYQQLNKYKHILYIYNGRPLQIIKICQRNIKTINKYQHINTKLFQTSAISTKLDKCQQTKPNVNKYHQYPQIETNNNKYQQMSTNVNWYQRRSTNINKIATHNNRYQQIQTKTNNTSTHISKYQQRSTKGSK